MSGVWLASYVVLWLVVLVLAFLLAGALRQLGLLQLRLGDDPGALITDTGLKRGTLRFTCAMGMYGGAIQVT